NAFISSASDFYSVLNRMSAEPDFRRLLTEFALGEFRKGLVEMPEPVESASMPTQQRLEEKARRANSYVTKQLGNDAKWIKLNKAIWNIIGSRQDRSFKVSDIDPVAEAASCKGDDLLAVLALLSRPSAHILKMEFRLGPNDDTEITPSEFVRKLADW